MRKMHQNLAILKKEKGIICMVTTKTAPANFEVFLQKLISQMSINLYKNPWSTYLMKMKIKVKSIF